MKDDELVELIVRIDERLVALTELVKTKYAAQDKRILSVDIKFWAILLIIISFSIKTIFMG